VTADDEEKKPPPGYEEVAADIRAGIERRSVGVKEAYEIVGRKIFGDDWIPALSEHDEKLIGDHGPKLEPLFTEQALRIGSVKPSSSPTLRDEIDRAVGRRVRMIAQRVTAAEWIKHHGPPAVFGSYDREALLKALADTNPQVAQVEMPTTGRRSRVETDHETAVRAELTSGELTLAKYADMTLKECTRFGGGMTTARKVKNRILDHLRK
jgi:hypothetical protein